MLFLADGLGYDQDAKRLGPRKATVIPPLTLSIGLQLIVADSRHACHLL